MFKTFLFIGILGIAKISYAAETFLFSFEKEGKESYLLGTGHFVNPKNLPKPLKDFLLQRSVYITESTDVQKPINKEDIEALGCLKKGEEASYIHCLETEDQEELLRYVKPFLLQKGGLVEPEDLNLKGLYAAYVQGHFLEGMDHWLLKEFHNKTILGLETVKDLSQFFEDMDFGNFVEIIKHKAGFTEEAIRILEERYLSGIIPDAPPETDEELKQRNSGWLPKTVSYHEQYPNGSLTAVGLDHLFGPDGLIDLLKKEGFSFKRMNGEGVFHPF